MPSPTSRALYRITFEADKPAYIIVNSRNGSIHVGENFISGHQQLSANTNVYVYIEPQEKPVSTGILKDGVIEASKDNAEVSTLVRHAFCRWHNNSQPSLRHFFHQ